MSRMSVSNSFNHLRRKLAEVVPQQIDPVWSNNHLGQQPIDFRMPPLSARDPFTSWCCELTRQNTLLVTFQSIPLRSGWQRRQGDHPSRNPVPPVSPKGQRCRMPDRRLGSSKQEPSSVSKSRFASFRRRHTYPAAGVMETSAITAPSQNGMMEGIRYVSGSWPLAGNLWASLFRNQKITRLALPPAHAATCVEVHADTARRLPPNAEPPLKPNHPIQSSAVPRTTLLTL